MASHLKLSLLVALIVASQLHVQDAKTEQPQDRVIKRQTSENSFTVKPNQQQSTRFTNLNGHAQVAGFSPRSSGGSVVLPANNGVQYSKHNYLNLQPAQYVPTATESTTTTTSQSPVVAFVETTTRATSQPIKSETHLQSTNNNFIRHLGNLELAMRQVSGDETLFQPSPILDVPGHSFDWSTSNGGSQVDRVNNLGRQPPTGYHEFETSPSSASSQPPPTLHSMAPQLIASTTPATSTTAAVATTTTTAATTTEHSNNILQLDSTLANTIAVNNHFTHQKEYPTTNMMANGSVSSLATDLNNNQVTYEGQATAPPPTPSDYYFSSSEKLPNNEGKAPNAWWAIGIGHEFERAINLTKDDYLDYCAKSELLVGNKQRSLCRMHPKVIPVVARALRMAIDECQSRFSSNRWNCSLAVVMQQRGHLAANSSGPAPGDLQVFGEFMRHSIRERSYLNAITSAALAHAMTKACSQGELPEECSCDRRIRSKSNRGKVEWTACSDDIDYGARFSRDWTDTTSNESDTSTMINTHNNEVGRRVFKSATDITCTCQGGDGTGLCQTKKCWKHLSPFTEIGDELLRRYESATHVQLSNRDPQKLRPVRRGVRKPKRKDLVFIDESPDYCSPDNRLGVLGTQNRHCNSTSSGPDSCSLLCCGRGYQVFVDEVEEDCNCKFVWCCQVKCDRCKRQITADICN